MQQIVGYGICALSFVLLCRTRTYRPERRWLALTSVEGFLILAAAFGGLRYAHAGSLGGAIGFGLLSGATFVGFMALLIGAIRFNGRRRNGPAMKFGQAWRAAGYSTGMKISPLGRNPARRPENIVARQVRQDWEVHHQTETPEEYLAARKVRIELALRSAREPRA